MDIKRRLEEESIPISRQSLHKLLCKYRLHQTYVNLPWKTPPKKVSPEMYSIIETEITKNDKLTSAQLKQYYQRNTQPLKHL